MRLSKLIILCSVRSLRTWWSWKVKRWYLSLSAPLKCCRQPVDVLLSHQLDQMEEKLFIPFSRHANLAEYWQGNSPIRDVDDIAVPLLVVHYQDDPLVPSSTIPSELFSLYPHLLLLTFPVGGHCGLLQRLHMAVTVAEEVAAQFIRQMLVLIDPPALQTATSQQRKQSDRNRSRRRVESLTLLRRSRNPFTAFQIRSSCWFHPGYLAPLTAMRPPRSDSTLPHDNPPIGIFRDDRFVHSMWNVSLHVDNKECVDSKLILIHCEFSLMRSRVVNATKGKKWLGFYVSPSSFIAQT